MYFSVYLLWLLTFVTNIVLWEIETLKPGVGNRPVITNAYLSQVDQIA